MNLCSTCTGRKGGINSSTEFVALVSGRLWYTFGVPVRTAGFTDDLIEEKTFHFPEFTKATTIATNTGAATFRREIREGRAFVISESAVRRDGGFKDS